MFAQSVAAPGADPLRCRPIPGAGDKRIEYVSLPDVQLIHSISRALRSTYTGQCNCPRGAARIRFRISPATHFVTISAGTATHRDIRAIRARVSCDPARNPPLCCAIAG